MKRSPDMAAQAAEYYSYGKNSWEIGPEIFKAQTKHYVIWMNLPKIAKVASPADGALSAI